MAENLDKTVSSLMTNLENFVSAKTIVGEPIQYKDVVIFPMADVSFGVAAGAFNKETKNNGAGGAGAHISPSAVLIIQNGTSKIVNIKDRDSINKIIEIVPDIMTKILDRNKNDKTTSEDDDMPRIEDYL